MGGQKTAEAQGIQYILISTDQEWARLLKNTNTVILFSRCHYKYILLRKSMHIYSSTNCEPMRQERLSQARFVQSEASSKKTGKSRARVILPCNKGAMHTNTRWVFAGRNLLSFQSKQIVFSTKFLLGQTTEKRVRICSRVDSCFIPYSKKSLHYGLFFSCGVSVFTETMFIFLNKTTEQSHHKTNS